MKVRKTQPHPRLSVSKTKRTGKGVYWFIRRNPKLAHLNDRKKPEEISSAISSLPVLSVFTPLPTVVWLFFITDFNSPRAVFKPIGKTLLKYGVTVRNYHKRQTSLYVAENRHRFKNQTGSYYLKRSNVALSFSTDVENPCPG